MSSEQDKDLVAKKMHVACCFVGFDYSHIHIIYKSILPYVCSRDMLQLFGKGLIGFLWKYVSNSHRMHL